MSEYIEMSDSVSDEYYVAGPAELMRRMHPDLYSDTVQTTTIALSRAVLDHQIDTLTSQSKEKEFEHLARQVAQRLICPNLRPQTGPTGGGDAKVDSETYPVAPEVTARWWIGEPAAGSQRWAFAFSAKKDWRSKVKADVTSILSTKREYKQIYFVTNQNVSDKKRSQVEDQLTGATGVRVTIIDRNWLLTKIYENELIGLAVSALHLVGNELPIEKVGPLDAARLSQLEELERKLADQTAYVGAEYQLAEDALEAALASRGLERQRDEVEGKFLRAIRLANKGQYRPQLIRANYNYAWTAHWWFEDFDLFSRQYDRVEELTINSDTADELEKLQTLWSLLSTLVAHGRMHSAEARLLERTARLRARLESLAGEQGRPNNALQAETILATMRLGEAVSLKDSEAIDAVWIDLADIVDRATHLGSYPLEPVYRLIERISEFVESAEYDRLFEKLVDVIARRRSEGEAGTMLSRRAIQKMSHARPYEAIRLFGRAEPLLIKEEYRGELIRALVGGSRAYDQVALPWASRAKALAAVDTCMAIFKREGEMPPIAMRAIQSVAWAEVVLGRVGHVLAAHALSRLTEPRANTPPNVLKNLREEWDDIDRILGVHLMSAPLSVLPKLERLPAALEDMDLMASAFALVYALGGLEGVIEEKFVPIDTSLAEIEQSIQNWRTQPILRRIAAKPTLTFSGRSTFRSVILGASLEFEVKDTEDSFGVAESILAAFEAFLATSQEADLVPQTEAFYVEVVAEEGSGHRLSLSFDDDDTSMQGRLVHPSNMEFNSESDLLEFMNDIREAVVGIMARMFHIPDLGGWMEKVAGKEQAFDRALILANLLLLNRNVFGNPSGAMLNEWIPEQGPRVPLTRGTPLRSTQTIKDKNDHKIAQGPPPKGLFDPETLSHQDRKVLSPINVQRWNKAGWRGTLFITDETPGVPPILGVGFTNPEMGQKIFEELQAKFSQYDESDDLRVAIIRGINDEAPESYAVTIGPNIANVELDEGSILSGLARINRMTPTTSMNLERFLIEYHAKGGFILAPAKMNPNNLAEADFFPRLGIAKTHLVVRHAWELDEYDWDLMAIHEGDTPFVPPGADASRVLKALERQRQAFAKRRQ